MRDRPPKTPGPPGPLVPALVVTALLGLGGLTLYLLLGSPDPQPAPPSRETEDSRGKNFEDSTAQGPPAPIQRLQAEVPRGEMVDPAPRPILDPARQKGALRMPDDTYLEPLNGAMDPIPARWESNKPYAPVVAKKAAIWPKLGRLEFYVHADGSRTITLPTSVRRQDVSGLESITMTAHPKEFGDVVPIPAGPGDLPGEPAPAGGTER